MNLPPQCGILTTCPWVSTAIGSSVWAPLCCQCSSSPIFRACAPWIAWIPGASCGASPRRSCSFSSVDGSGAGLYAITPAPAAKWQQRMGSVLGLARPATIRLCLASPQPMPSGLGSQTKPPGTTGRFRLRFLIRPPSLPPPPSAKKPHVQWCCRSARDEKL